MKKGISPRLVKMPSLMGTPLVSVYGVQQNQRFEQQVCFFGRQTAPFVEPLVSPRFRAPTTRRLRHSLGAWRERPSNRPSPRWQNAPWGSTRSRRSQSLASCTRPTSSPYRRTDRYHSWIDRSSACTLFRPFALSSPPENRLWTRRRFVKAGIGSGYLQKLGLFNGGWPRFSALRLVLFLLFQATTHGPR